MAFDYNEVVAKVADTLVRAGSTFRQDKKDAYKRAIEAEELERAKWNLSTILENAEVAECNRSRQFLSIFSSSEQIFIAIACIVRMNEINAIIFIYVLEYGMFGFYV